MRLVVGALAAALSMPTAAADVWSFRGFNLGGSVDQLVATFPYFACKPAEKTTEGDVECVAEGGPSVSQYADQSAEKIVAYAFGGKIGSINLTFYHCQAIALGQAMRARFGAPKGIPSAYAWSHGKQNIV